MVKISRDVLEAYLVKLYQVVLGRDPDPDGFSNWLAALESAGIDGFKLALDGFSESDEFKLRRLGIPEALGLESYPGFSFSSLDPEILDLLFDRTATYWRGMASRPENIYWSVLTHPEYRGILAPELKSEFMASGQADVDRIYELCSIVGYEFDDCKSYLEYGCGVGRTVANLPSSIPNVNCADFSEVHLEEARVNLRYARSREINFFLVDSLSSLSRLPGNQDVIHSILVLQHNTPPVIQAMLVGLLSLLAPGGIAILHIPIAKAFYSFDATDYLSSATSGKGMEMHVLPRYNIYQAAAGAGCAVAFSYCSEDCGGDIYSEILVFRRDLI